MESCQSEFEFHLPNLLIIYPQNISLAFLRLRIIYITLECCEKSYKLCMWDIQYILDFQHAWIIIP